MNHAKAQNHAQLKISYVNYYRTPKTDIFFLKLRKLNKEIIYQFEKETVTIKSTSFKFLCEELKL